MMLLLLKCFVLSNARSLTGLRPVEFAKFAHHAGARSEARERCESKEQERAKENKQAEERSKERQKLASGFGLQLFLQPGRHELQPSARILGVSEHSHAQAKAVGEETEVRYRGMAS